MADIIVPPTPTTPANINDVSLSGSPAIDGLLWGTYFSSENSGPETTISFSFASPNSSFSSGGGGYTADTGEPWVGLRSLTTMEKGQFLLALQNISQVSNILFQEIEETESQVGTIRVAWTQHERPENSAWAYFPYESTSSGDIWLNDSTLNPVRSDGFFQTLLLHELGHSLGLKHSDETRLLTTTLPDDLNGIDYTLMSYCPLAHLSEAVSADFWPQTLMQLDIYALQHLYGKDSTITTGDNTYTYVTSTRYYETLWDAGGTDTLTFTGSDDLNVNINPGTWSDVGTAIHYWDNEGQLLNYVKTKTLFITGDTVIENISADSGYDSLQGNDANNQIKGGSGHDTIRGAAGADKLYGEQGNDFLVGDSGRDTLSGGSGHDKIYAGQNDHGDDLIAGGSGNDTLGGGKGDDFIIGGGVSGHTPFNDDAIKASDDGADILYGGDGNDTLLGGGWQNDGATNNTFDFGEEVITGTFSNKIWGGNGDDLLIGSGGTDILEGGRGQDTFYFRGAIGHDTITDFDLKEDNLIFSDIQNFPSGTAPLRDISTNTDLNGKSGLLINFDGSNSLFLIGLTVDDINAIAYTIS